MPEIRSYRKLVLVFVCLMCCQFGCSKTPTDSREGAYYYLNGEASGLLADFTSASCLVWPTGNTTISEPHVELSLTLGDNEQVGDPRRFSPIMKVLISPLPSPDRVRKASVVGATVFAQDHDSTFAFSAVAAEYEYGVPLEENTSFWVHTLKIPEQTFNHPRDGEITVSGELDGLFVGCN